MEIVNKREDVFSQSLPPVIGLTGTDVTLLWKGDLAPDAETHVIELSEPLENFKFVLACAQGGDSIFHSGSLLYVPMIVSQAYNDMWVINHNLVDMANVQRFSFAVLKNIGYALYRPTVEGQAQLTGLMLLGIK